MPRGRLTPYRQGHLDGLCGFYSVVNAVRYALRTVELRRPYMLPRPRHLSRAEAKSLFMVLLGTLVRSHRQSRTIVKGITPNQLETLLRQASKWLRCYRGLKLSVSHPLRSRTRVSAKTLSSCIDKHLLAAGTAAIVGACDPWEHWTVATRVTTSRLYLLDSEGDRSVAMKRGRRAFRYHAGLIDPSCLYLLTITEVERR